MTFYIQSNILLATVNMNSQSQNKLSRSSFDTTILRTTSFQPNATLYNIKILLK